MKERRLGSVVVLLWLSGSVALWLFGSLALWLSGSLMRSSMASAKQKRQKAGSWKMEAASCKLEALLNVRGTYVSTCTHGM